MKNTILICAFILAIQSISAQTTSQTLVCRPFGMKNIKWLDDLKEYEVDSTKIKFKTKNPKAFLSYDEFTLIDLDTMHIYFHEAPEESEDSVMVKRVWNEVENDNGEPLFVCLFYYKEDNVYMLRVLNTNDETGRTYYMNPFKIDTIPVGQYKPVISKNN